MKLLTVGSLPPEWGGPSRGGVATFHAALLEGLADHDEVELVGVLPPAPLSGSAPVPAFPRPEGAGLAEFYENLLDRLRPDVVLINHVAHTVGVAHARLSGAPPAIGVAHSWHNITFRTGEERRRARTVTEEALGGLAALVCPSRHCRREGERLGLPLPARTEVIHYPLQPLYMEEGIDVVAPKRRGVLYVGSLVGRKNPAAVIEAVAAGAAPEATLIGEGEEEESLRALVDRLDLRDRVRISALPGGAHLADLRDLYLRSSALCLPSASESFGIVFIEALACGTPVVGFGPTVMEIQDTVGIEIGVALEGGSPAEVVAAIEQVQGCEWNRPELRSVALEAFGLPKATAAYVDICSSVRTGGHLERAASDGRAQE